MVGTAETSLATNRQRNDAATAKGNFAQSIRVVPLTYGHSRSVAILPKCIVHTVARRCTSEPRIRNSFHWSVATQHLALNAGNANGSMSDLFTNRRF